MMSNGKQSVPKLKINVIITGTRGDVQPFLALAVGLKEYGHCVRFTTHAEYEGFVRSCGVDFYTLGGDPRIMVECFMRAKSILSSASSIRDISLQGKQLQAIIRSIHPACTDPDPITGEPFRAQATIANPSAFGSIDVAEGLGIPLHIFYTVPWTPTDAFPHAFTQSSKLVGARLSYKLVDSIIWWGIRGWINDLRKNKLKLAPLGYFNTSHVSISHLPTTYMWSRHVLSKLTDWGPLVDVAGYCFLNLESKYEPPQELVMWMQKGDKPIYIGFGSAILTNSENITDIILKALKNTGQRGIINQGWGDLGTHPNIPEDVFVLKDCPHDWLFPQCRAVVHHGGPGTAAAALKAGCPMTIIPMCGDQFLWGDVMFQKGVAPAPLSMTKLSVESLSEAIRFMLKPEVKAQAMELAELIKEEDGVGAAVESFHRHLQLQHP